MFAHCSSADSCAWLTPITSARWIYALGWSERVCLEERWPSAEDQADLAIKYGAVSPRSTLHHSLAEFFARVSELSPIPAESVGRVGRNMWLVRVFQFGLSGPDEILFVKIVSGEPVSL